jgi:hypothetical protein
MKALLISVALAAASCQPAAAQGEPSGGVTSKGCWPPDAVYIKDDGPGKAVITYHNSENQCSNNWELDMVSPAGIEVHVSIKVGDAETIIVTPVDPNMMAFPPEADVEDGSQTEIVVMGGLS